jgi:hypothetical protein
VSGDRYAIHCFGGTDKPADAEAVFIAVRDRLHSAVGNTATGGVVFGQLETATPRVEEDTGWPVHIGIFRVLTA